jgi:hypothetical protein
VLWGVYAIETSFSAFPFGFFFPENMGAVSSEDCERLNRDISGMEKGYSGQFMPNMLADNCWILIRETPTGE